MTACFALQNKKIWVAGHNGLVGAALVRRLQQENCTILTVDRHDLDLRRQAAVESWLADNRPDAIILAAAHVGGIGANRDFPADFIYNNLAIETNIIHGAYQAGVKKLLFLGSSCIYPRAAAQPIVEDALLTGPLESTNEFYAIAKIAGIKMCQAYRRQHGCDFIAAMPCNLYGPGDTYHENLSHVIPSLILKMQAARQAQESRVELWGTGTPLREFMHCDDAADALVFLLQHYSGEELINVGTGEEIAIAALAAEIAAVTGFDGAIHFNPDHPDGVMRKVMDSSRLRAMGWRPRITLRDGLTQAYADYTRRTELVRAA